MRVLLAALLCAAISVPARAQAPAESFPVSLNGTERGVLLDMCAAAQWAARQRFDGVCDYLRVKFETAQREAAERAKPEPAPQQEPAK